MQTILKNRFKQVLSEKSFLLFSELVDYVESFDMDGDDIICSFPEEEEPWTICQPLNYSGKWGELLKEKVKNYAPKNHQKFLDVCGEMCFGEAGGVSQTYLGNGFSGTLHVVVGADLNESALGMPYSEDFFSPIDIGFNIFYFIPPGENRLFLSDEYYSTVVDTLDPIEAYFRELHYALRRYDKINAFSKAKHRSEWTQELQI